MVTVEQLADYVGTKETTGFIETCLDGATQMISNYVGNASVPQATFDNCVLTVGSELFHRRSAPNGVTQFAAFDGQAVRVARDPMTSVYPILLQFVGVGI